jgi:hypothetical protein
MSLGFRFFVLLLVLFCAAWVYRTRENEIYVWLGMADPPPLPAYGVPGGRSQVNETLDLYSRVAVHVKGVAWRPRTKSKGRPRGVLESINRPTLMAGENDDWSQPGGELLDDDADYDDWPSPLDGLVLPDDNGDWTVDPQNPHGVVDPAVEPQDDETSSDSVPSYRIHHVVSGDSFWKIALKYLGKGHRFREVEELNPLIVSDGGRLHIGMEVRVPAGR